MKKILCLDFDGVIHSYTSGWQGPRTIKDQPVDGAMKFISDAVDSFRVCIHSSRSNYFLGRYFMAKWLSREMYRYWGAHATKAEDVLGQIEWPTRKPPAFVTIDDRAFRFTGEFPLLSSLENFKPWNKEKR